MNQKLKRIWNRVTSVLVAVLVLFAALLWGARLVGLDVFVVQSGSMEPDYPTGSVVYVRAVDPAELEVGDVITFRLSESLRATHRIIEVVEQDGQIVFRTKGDANDHADNGLLTPDNIVGKVVFSIPCLGYLVAYIQSPSGTYLVVAVGALVLLLTFLPDLLTDGGRKKKEETKK